MRMTASWLDPAVGSAEYKDVARELCAPPWQARLRSSYLCSLKAKRHRPASLTRPEPAAVLGPVKKWPGNACRTLNGLSDGHP
jgi:hypothetical protein